MASLIRSFKTYPKGPSLFVGFDEDIYRPGTWIFSYRKQDTDTALSVIDGLGTAFETKLGPAPWKGLTAAYKQEQKSNYIWHEEEKRYSTPDERAVRAAWKQDTFLHHKMKRTQLEPCHITYTPFECANINVYKDTTILNTMTSGGSIGTASALPPEWDLNSYFQSIDGATEWNTFKEDDDAAAEDDSFKSDMDESTLSNDNHHTPGTQEPPSSIHIHQPPPLRVPPMEDDQHDAIHQLPLDLRPSNAQPNEVLSIAGSSEDDDDDDDDDNMIDTPNTHKRPNSNIYQAPALENKSHTFHLVSIESLKLHSGIPPADQGEIHPVAAQLNSWFNNPDRHRDKQESPSLLDWLIKVTLACHKGSPTRKSMECILDQNWSLSVTVFWHSTILKQTPMIQQLADIHPLAIPGTSWQPTLIIAYMTDTEDLDAITAALASTWIFSNPLIQDSAVIPAFLLDLSFHTNITPDELVPWLTKLDSEQPQTQMQALRYWQTWLYFKQIPDREEHTTEPMSIPTPYIDVSEDTQLLLNLEYIKSRVTLSNNTTEVLSFTSSPPRAPSPPHVDAGEAF